MGCYQINDENKDLLGMTREEVQARIETLGEGRFRADQVLNWLFKQNVQDFEEMLNLPGSLKKRLKEEGYKAFSVHKRYSQKANDGTERFLLGLADGESVEAVYLPEDQRHTVCLSSQVGCGMGCSFCATGQSGLIRHLTPGEMVDSVRQIGIAEGVRISHVVVMGQGEPFANYDQLLHALQILNAPYALGIAARHITVSTAGIVPRILDFAEEKNQYNLAVSLHAADDVLRERLMPINRAYPLETLKEACQIYAKKTGRRVTLEYIMLEGVNDRSEDMERLIRFAKGWLSHVNLIPFHAVPDTDWQASPPETLKRFLQGLKRAGIPVSLRRSRGEEVLAACGQLRQTVLEANGVPTTGVKRT